jgi:hypothetical protein
MNRIKADLSYKTKREYEEMIRRLENEMQFNHRPFSSREEARILHEITTLKHGIGLLETYEEKKRIYENHKETLSAKKNEQDVSFIFYFFVCFVIKFIKFIKVDLIRFCLSIFILVLES